jgi:hypothetical protein
MTIHVNMTTNWPPMSSMVVGGYKSVDATNLRGGYWQPSIVTVQIFNYKNGHSIRPNKVALKYLNFKKDVNPDAHVRMFNAEVLKNVETSKNIYHQCI